MKSQSYTLVVAQPIPKKLEKHYDDFYAIIQYSLGKLFSTVDRLVDPFNVVIEFESVSGCYGEVNWCEKTRTGVITISPSLSVRGIMLAVIHESVHVKQYSTGELRDASSGFTYFRRKKYLEKDVTYYDRPWEIDAFGREYGIFSEYIKQNADRLKGVRWANYLF
jgi:hypothetical protein